MDSNRRVVVKGLGILFLGFIPFLNACNRLSGEIQSKEATAQRSPGTRTSSAPRKPTPPIDAAAPSRIETATFTLG